MCYLRFKRIFDIIAASTGLLMLSVPLMVIAVLVRRNMGSPVLFLQKRPGLNNQLFNMYKFRTMNNKCDENRSLLPDSQRLTQFGRLLRRYSLDELPQLLNVVKGDMSIIGPRPLLTTYLPYLSAREATRHNVKPGITGLAQVAGRNTVQWDKRLELDAVYVETISLKTDFSILIRTVMLVLRRSGVQEDTAEEGNLAEIRSSEKDLR